MIGRGSSVRVGRRRSESAVPPPNITRFLLHGEQLRYVDRRHPIVLVQPIAIAFTVCVLVGLLVSVMGAGAIVEVYAVTVVGTLAWLLYRVLRWGRDVLVVTDRRVFEVRSLITSRVVIKPVFRQSVVFVQSPLGEWLNFGKIATETPTGDQVHTFRWIHDPQAFYEAVTDRAV